MREAYAFSEKIYFLPTYIPNCLNSHKDMTLGLTSVDHTDNCSLYSLLAFRDWQSVNRLRLMLSSSFILQLSVSAVHCTCAGSLRLFRSTLPGVKGWLQFSAIFLQFILFEQYSSASLLPFYFVDVQ